MEEPNLRFRQVHLDFHTSEKIAEIGVDFDPEEFASTLKTAHVNSVTCFARGHHGWIYYDTKRNPERHHPNLRRNLLLEQIEACHANDIRVPIYITVQWDHFTANEHPEWLVIDETGRIVGPQPYEPGFNRDLCVNSPYVEEFLKPHVEEVLELIPTDGIFFDIVRPRNCSCKYCRNGMESQGIDPSNNEDRIQFGVETINKFKLDMTKFVRKYNKDCAIFYNSGHISSRHRHVKDAYTHFELESLPSGGWGYMHFPITARLARTFGLDTLGMTGKFHTTWGDFHSFKNLPALEYECFQMLALGSKCSVGDQLHPKGKIDPDVYSLIGKVYSQVEEVEEWCERSRPVTEIGLFTNEKELYGEGFPRTQSSILGAARMLEEGAHQFDLVDEDSDFAKYSVIVLPDDVLLTDELEEKIRKYLAKGGALISSFESGMDTEKNDFRLDNLGVRKASDGPKDMQGEFARGKHFPWGNFAEYLLPQKQIGEGLPATEHVMYARGMDVKMAGEGEVLAETVSPYFDRRFNHFSSHQQAPSSGKVSGPAIVRNGKSIYFSHPIFTEYDRRAPYWGKRLFLNALDLMVEEPLVRHEGPSTLRATINEQPDKKRWVLHLLHYIPERRSQTIDIIEDVIPIANVELSIRLDKAPREVQLVPSKEVIPFEYREGRVFFQVPEVRGHQMVSLEFRGD